MLADKPNYQYKTEGTLNEKLLLRPMILTISISGGISSSSGGTKGSGTCWNGVGRGGDDFISWTLGARVGPACWAWCKTDPVKIKASC